MAQARVLISLLPVDGDDEEVLDRHARRLRQELLELPVDGVDFDTTDSAVGAKGAGEVVAGALAVLAAADPGYLEMILNVVQSYVRRNDGRSVRMRVGDQEITVTGASEVETAVLVSAFVAQIEDARTR